MNKWLMVLVGIVAITVTACKEESGSAELKATFSLKTWEDNGNQLQFGPVKNIFSEKEPIAFDMILTNEGEPTETIEYASCGFDLIEIYDEAGEKVYDSEVTTTGCSGQWNIKVVYTGESIGIPTLWDQELYEQDPNTGAISGTGEYLPAGEYTVEAVARFQLESADAEWTEIQFSTQSLTIEANP